VSISAETALSTQGQMAAYGFGIQGIQHTVETTVAMMSQGRVSRSGLGYADPGFFSINARGPVGLLSGAQFDVELDVEDSPAGAGASVSALSVLGSLPGVNLNLEAMEMTVDMSSPFGGAVSQNMSAGLTNGDLSIGAVAAALGLAAEGTSAAGLAGLGITAATLGLALAAPNGQITVTVTTDDSTSGSED
jgi:hypothetical protein